MYDEMQGENRSFYNISEAKGCEIIYHTADCQKMLDEEWAKRHGKK